MAEPTAVERMTLAKRGYAMPDGSYYIRAGSVGASDLHNAIEAVGHGQEDSRNEELNPAIRMHIMKRAKSLGLSSECPDNWQADGSLKHDALDDLADGYLAHFGITGMRWGGHLPGTEAVGGKGNPGGANGPSAKYKDNSSPDRKPAAFIQRGDRAGDNGGDSGPSGKDDVKTPDQQAKDSVDFLSALRDHVARQAEDSQAEADDANRTPSGLLNHNPESGSAPASSPSPKPKSGLTSQQANAVNEATQKHLAAVSQAANKAKAATAAHKKAVAKAAKHPNKAHAKAAVTAASKQHAAHMNHLKQTTAAAHKAHQAAVAKMKAKGKALVKKGPIDTSKLDAADKKALSQLSPVQRSALKKLTPEQRAHPEKLTLKQQNDLRLTPNERKSLSHLSPKQKAALAKATAASAKKRHEAALARKAGITGNKSVAKAKKVTAAAAAKRTTTQTIAYNKLRLNAQNGTMHDGMNDPQGTFVEHHGVKGMHWGTKKVRGAFGFPNGTPANKKTQGVVSKGVNKTVDYAIKHPVKTVVAVRGAQVAYQHRAQIADFGVKAVGTAKIVAHIIKVMNAQRKSPAGQEALAIGRKYVQGYVVHEDGTSSLEHHGVKGMHWGIRRNTHESLDRKITKTKAQIDYHEQAMKNVKSHIKDVNENGTQAELFKKKHGTGPNALFELTNGKTKTEALAAHRDALTEELDTHAFAHQVQSNRLTRLQVRKTKLSAQHSDDPEEFLEHHGIKGMKWGIRRNGGHPGQMPAHLVSPDAQKAHEVARTIHEHGTAAVGNDDLQHLVNRQRLIQQHAQLNPGDPSTYRKGLDFVKTLTNDTNTAINAVNTGRRAIKTVHDLSGEVPAHRQSRRTRNKPLNVVSVRAA